MRQQGNIGTVTVASITPPFTHEQQLAYRQDYERRHPNIFQENPAMIDRSSENAIIIRIFSRAEADALMTEAAAQRKN